VPLDPKDPQPIVYIMRRARKRERKSHGGQWKIAYADFVTAMMVFFLIMWIVSMIPQTQKDSIADYFKGKSKNQVADSTANAIGEDKSDTKDETIIDDLEEAKQYLERLKELRREIEAFIKENADLMKNSNDLLIEETPDGLTITLAENKKPMFVLGSATLEATTAQVLQKLGKPLSSSRFKIKVEGHTDASAYRPGATYTNWELSADRANAARRELLAGGLSESKLSQVIGYADNNLFVKDDPRNPLNRRITITAFTPKSKVYDPSAPGKTDSVAEKDLVFKVEPPKVDPPKTQPPKGAKPN
jgi:chemotaxis protein MotB